MDITIVYSEPTKRARQTLYALTDEDTKHSVAVVAKALRRLHHSVSLFPITEDSIQSISTIRADCIFNLIEWTGLDLPLSLLAFQLLYKKKVPYTGIDVGGLFNTGKIRMKQLFDLYAIPTPQWQVFYSPSEPIRKTYRYPVIIKPALEHCSIGITPESIVHNCKQLRLHLAYSFAQFKQPFIIEELIRGSEYQVSLIEDASSIIALPPAQIVFNKQNKHKVLTFHGKWTPGHPDYVSQTIQPSDLTTNELHELTRSCIKAFSLFNLHDYARIDVKIHKSRIYFLEINANPTLDDDPDYAMSVSCKKAKISFTELIGNILNSALSRRMRKNY